MVTIDLPTSELPLIQRIDKRAAQVDWRKVFLFLLMAVPFAVGMTCWYVVKSVGWVLSWLYAAAVEGWTYAAERHRR
jgi:Na+/H+ antiporter NhaC